MGFLILLYVVLLFSAAVLMGVLTWFVSHKKHLPGAQSFMGVLAALMGYVLFTGLIMVAGDPSLARFFESIQWFFLALIPPLILIFILKYHGFGQWVNQRSFALLAVIPVITEIVIWTNSFHGWMYGLDQVEYLLSDGYLLIPDRIYGLWYWVLLVYSYVCVGGGILVLLNSIQETKSYFRQQTSWLLFGMFVAVVFNVVDVLHLLPRPWFLISPFGFTIAGGIFFGVLNRSGFFEMLPLTRSQLVDRIQNAMIVVDSNYRVVDINLSAHVFLASTVDKVLSRPAAEVLKNWSEMKAHIQKPDFKETDVSIIQAAQGGWYDMRASVILGHKNAVRGYMFVFHEVTERKLAEENLSRQAVDLQAVSEISTRLASNLDINRLLQSMVEMTKERFSLYHVHIFITNEAGDGLALAAAAGEAARELLREKPVIPLNKPHSLIARAARTKKGILVNDVSQDPDYLPFYLLSKTRAEISAPLLLGSRVLGVLDVQADQIDRFTPQDLTIHMTLAAQIAISLQNAQTFSQFQHVLKIQDKALQLLYGLGREINRKPPVGALLAWLIMAFPKAIQYSGICIVGIEFEGQQYGRLDIEAQPSRIAEEIVIGGQVVGKVSLAYTQPEKFLPEEESLLGNVVQRVQNYIVENLIQTQQAKLEEATQIARMASFMVNLRKQVVVFTDQFFELMGTSAAAEGGYEMPVEAMLTRFIYPDDVVHMANELTAVQSDSQNGQIDREYRFRSNGVIRHMLYRAQIERDENGHATSMVTTIQDITERKLAEDEIKSRAEYESMLNKITQAAITYTDFETMSNVLANRIGELFGADGCYIVLWDEAMQVLVPTAAYGKFTRQFEMLAQGVPGKSNIIHETLAGKQVITVDDVADSAYWDLQETNKDQLHSLMVLPLSANEQNLGAALIGFAGKHEFSEEENSRAEQIAQQIALAMLKTHLLEAEREQRQSAEILRDIGLALSTSLDQKTVLRNVIEMLAELTAYEAAAIMRVDHDRIVLLDMIGYEYLDHIAIKKDSNLNSALGIVPLLRKVYETKAPLIVADTQQESLGDSENSENAFRSWVGIPVIFNDDVIAMITAEHSQPGFFKSLNTTRLISFAGQAALALENARLFEQMQQMAVTDVLTKLYNRRYFFELSQNEFKRARRYHQSLSVIMFDIDHFKRINDTYGHLTGDVVLKEVARLCKDTLRDVDVLARYGGEEFVVLLPETDLNGAVLTAERLRKMIENNPIKTETDGDVTITISLGASSLDQVPNLQGENAASGMEKLVDQADQALYVSKQSGRNQVSAFEPSAAKGSK